MQKEIFFKSKCRKIISQIKYQIQFWPSESEVSFYFLKPDVCLAFRYLVSNTLLTWANLPILNFLIFIYQKCGIRGIIFYLLFFYKVTHILSTACAFVFILFVYTFALQLLFWSEFCMFCHYSRVYSSWVRVKPLIHNARPTQDQLGQDSGRNICFRVKLPWALVLPRSSCVLFRKLTSSCLFFHL